MIEINYECFVSENETDNVVEEIVRRFKKEFDVVEKVEWNEATFDEWVLEGEELDESAYWDVLWEEIIPHEEKTNKWKIHVYVPPEVSNVPWGVSIFVK